MSFSFTAAGSRDDVIRQLRLVKEGTHGPGPLGPRIAELVAGELACDESGNAVAQDYRMHYLVEGSGHSGGGSAVSLSLTVRPMYIRDAQAEPAGEDCAG